MAFHIGERYEKTFSVEDMTGDALAFNTFDGLDIYWVFTFRNGDIAKIEGTVGNDTVTFEIPEDFLTAERAGPLKHQLYLKDSDGVPSVYTDAVNDVLIRGGPTEEELGL